MKGKNYIKKIEVILLVLVVIFNVVGLSHVSAASSNDFWKSAGQWFTGVQRETNNNVSSQSIDIVNSFMDMVNYVGTVIIFIATMFLGLKYIFGSVDSKADVKESLITLLIACVFFFGWQYIRDIILIGNGTQLFITSNSDTTYKLLFARLLYVVTQIVKVAAIVGVIFVGVKYIFAGASGKAELKGKSAYFFIGIILTFCCVTVLTVFSNMLVDLLK